MREGEGLRWLPGSGIAIRHHGQRRRRRVRGSGRVDQESLAVGSDVVFKQIVIDAGHDVRVEQSYGRPVFKGWLASGERFYGDSKFSQVLHKFEVWPLLRFMAEV